MAPSAPPGTLRKRSSDSHSLIAVPERADEIPDSLPRFPRRRIDHYETLRKTKDGRFLTVSLTASPIRDAAGTIIAASKIARNITEQKMSFALNERLAAIVESSDHAIISKDLQGYIRTWNKGAEEYSGTHPTRLSAGTYPYSPHPTALTKSETSWIASGAANVWIITKQSAKRRAAAS